MLAFHQLAATQVQGEDPAVFPTHLWVVPRSTKPKTRHDKQPTLDGTRLGPLQSAWTWWEMLRVTPDIYGLAEGPEVQDSFLTCSRIVWSLSTPPYFVGVPSLEWHQSTMFSPTGGCRGSSMPIPAVPPYFVPSYRGNALNCLWTEPSVRPLVFPCHARISNGTGAFLPEPISCTTRLPPTVTAKFRTNEVQPKR